MRFSRICREEVRIWECERATARSHSQIRVLTTEIHEEPEMLARVNMIELVRI